MPKIKPFAMAGGHTVFENSILDYIMPRAKGNCWKIVCATLRKTRGWVDPLSPTGRKESDLISATQYAELTGIPSMDTVQAAIKEALKKRFIVRVREGRAFRYALNLGYELEIDSENRNLFEGLIDSENRNDIVPKTGMTKENKQSNNIEKKSKKNSRVKTPGKKRGRPPKADKEKAEAETNPLSFDPRIQKVRDMIQRYPKQEAYPIIIRVLGDNPDWQKLDTCFAVWVSHDYRPTNLAWLTQWYPNPPEEVQKLLAPASQAIVRTPWVATNGTEPSEESGTRPE